MQHSSPEWPPRLVSRMVTPPAATYGHATGGDLWVEWSYGDKEGIHFKFGSGGDPWGKGTSTSRNVGDWTTFVPQSYMVTPSNPNFPPFGGIMSDGTTNIVSMNQHEKITKLISGFQNYLSGSRPFASAPIRSSPRRTYDPGRPSPDPQGDYVPSFLASMQFRDQAQWKTLKGKMEEFGRMSALFDEVSVRQFGKTEGTPFQLEIRKFGRKRRGSKRNLIDVGYGVSQALPVLVELLRPDAPSLFLLQQPEVHLHPSAQAALGSLFCRTVQAGRQLIVETHSEFIIDRIRMDLRDRQTTLMPDDVSILFFERSDLDVRIHSLRFDEQGNVLGAPDGYGQFFMDEVRRSVGL